jgi:hypothetical protein
MMLPMAGSLVIFRSLLPSAQAGPRSEAAIGKVWRSWFEGGSTDTILRKIMWVAGVFGIEVVVAHLAHLMLVRARESIAVRVPSSPKSPYKWAATSG